MRRIDACHKDEALSLVLANVYFHYAPDKWFEDEVKPQLLGYAHLSDTQTVKLAFRWINIRNQKKSYN